jgi:hypothetical protein
VSLGSASQRLIDRLVGRREPAVKPDDPIARMIARTSGHLRPARDFRWRLRGRVLNRFVAAREGLVVEAPRNAQMGRIGRAVLYASVGLAISVSAVGAASTSALPGDPLYGVKRQVEELRMEIAPPSARPMLAAMALEERLSEVERLAASGNWARAELAEQEVDAAVATVRGFGGSLPADQIAQLAHHTQVLTELLTSAPASARAGLQRALIASAAAATGVNTGNHFGSENQLDGGTTGSSATGTNGGNQGGNVKPAGGGANSGKQNGSAAQASQPAASVPPASEPAHVAITPAPHPTSQPQPSSSPDGASPSRQR